MNVKRERRPVLIIELTEEEARTFVLNVDSMFNAIERPLLGRIANSLASTYYEQTGDRLTAEISLV